MEELFERYRSGDLSAREEIIIKNMRLVKYLVGGSSYGASDDNFQLGYVGLIKAVDTFDVNAGYKFSTYAAKCILHEVGLYYRSLKREKAEYILDDYVSKDVEVPLIDCLSDGVDITDRVNNKDFNRVLLKLISKMENERDKKILKLYFGFDCKPKKMAEIGEEVGLTQSNISRLIIQYLALFKDYVRELGEFGKPVSLSERFSDYSRFKLNYIISTLSDDEKEIVLKRLDNADASLTVDEIVKLYSKIIPFIGGSLSRHNAERKLFGRIAKDKVALICLMDIYRNRVESLIRNNHFDNADFDTLEICGLIGCAKGIVASETYSLMSDNVTKYILEELESGNVSTGDKFYSYAKIVQSGVVPFIDSVISAGEDSYVLDLYYNRLKSSSKISRENKLDVSYVNRVIDTSTRDEMSLIGKTSITKRDYLDALDYIDQPLFREIVKILSVKETFIYIMRRGLGGKSFSFRELGEFFEMSEEDVKSSYMTAARLVSAGEFGKKENEGTGFRF